MDRDEHRPQLGVVLDAGRRLREAGAWIPGAVLRRWAELPPPERFVEAHRTHPREDGGEYLRWLIARQLGSWNPPPTLGQVRSAVRDAHPGPARLAILRDLVSGLDVVRARKLARCEGWHPATVARACAHTRTRDPRLVLWARQYAVPETRTGST